MAILTFAAGSLHHHLSACRASGGRIGPAVPPAAKHEKGEPGNLAREHVGAYQPTVLTCRTTGTGQEIAGQRMTAVQAELDKRRATLQDKTTQIRDLQDEIVDHRKQTGTSWSGRMPPASSRSPQACEEQRSHHFRPRKMIAKSVTSPKPITSNID